MSRYRPPAPSRSPYITPAGAKAMRTELKHLWEVERPQVTAAVHEAAKNGDRSENGDYIYGKRRLREIDRRVRYLSKRLEQLQIVDRLPADTSRVFFGAWVTVVDDSDATLTLRIVGYDEIDAAQHHISIDSPMAKALLGRRLDDTVKVQTPTGTRRYRISDIRYVNPGHKTNG